jgi:hypothetical protein
MFKNKNRKKDNTKIRAGSFTLKTIPIRENGDNYYYIENLEQATEKQCKEYDKLNQLIFQKYNGIYDKITNKIGDCPFKLDKKPDPPKSPNNYESLIKWRAMNSLKNVSQQTIATLYLLKHNFNISLDFDKEGIKPSEIIDIALKQTNNDLELMKSEGYYYLESLKQKKEQEKNNINNNNPRNKNFRSKPKNIGCISGSSNTDNLSDSSSSIEIDFGFHNSTYRPNSHSQTNQNQNHNHNHNHHNIVKKISNVNLHMISPNQYNNQQIEKTEKQSIQKLPTNNIHMKCERPEHHTINEKMGHFNNLYPTINNPDYYNNNSYNSFSPPLSLSTKEPIAPTAPPDYNS